ncbi:MAG: hypothetical protein WBM12_01960 [Pseudolabrys sp.]
MQLAYDRAVTALTKTGSVEGLKKRNLVVRDGGAKKKFAVFVASLSIEPHTCIEIYHERIVGDCHDFSPNSSRIGEQNHYFSLAASAFVFISMLLMTSLHP